MKRARVPGDGPPGTGIRFLFSDAQARLDLEQRVARMTEESHLAVELLNGR